MATEFEKLRSDSIEGMELSLKALENAGGTLELMEVIRNNERATKAVVEAGSKFLLSRYTEEESSSRCAYPEAYLKVVEWSSSKVVKSKPGQEQLVILQEHLSDFPGVSEKLQLAEQYFDTPLISEAEGKFAVLDAEFVAAKICPHITNSTLRYVKASQWILDRIASTRQFENWQKEQMEADLETDYLDTRARDIMLFREVIEQQNGSPVPVIDAQFGLRHRARSVRRARKFFYEEEFGLGLFVVGCMLLTHPEREESWDHLHIDCAGDTFVMQDSDKSEGAPYFGVHDVRFHSGATYVNSHSEFYGSATGFVSQD